MILQELLLLSGQSGIIVDIRLCLNNVLKL